MAINILINAKRLFSLLSNLKANHNKDYSVVKTFEAAQVAFFYVQYFVGWSGIGTN